MADTNGYQPFNADTYKAEPGSKILSDHWNALVDEIKWLGEAKVNRSGDTIKGDLTIEKTLTMGTQEKGIKFHFGDAVDIESLGVDLYINNNDKTTVIKKLVVSESLTIESESLTIENGLKLKEGVKINKFSNDTLENSNETVPTEHAVKTYIDEKVEKLENNKVNRSGDTITGDLTIEKTLTMGTQEKGIKFRFGDAVDIESLGVDLYINNNDKTTVIKKLLVSESLTLNAKENKTLFSIEASSDQPALRIDQQGTGNGLNVKGKAFIGGFDRVTGNTNALNVKASSDYPAVYIDQQGTGNGLYIKGNAFIGGFDRVTGNNNALNVKASSDYPAVYIGQRGMGDALYIEGNLSVTETLKIGQFFPTKGIENLRIIRGFIRDNGRIISGEGFQCAKTETGLYYITFNQAFTDYPAVIATQDYPQGQNSEHYKSGGNTRDNAVVVTIQKSFCRIKCGNSDGDRLDRYFSFVCIGKDENS